MKEDDIYRETDFADDDDFDFDQKDYRKEFAESKRRAKKARKSGKAVKRRDAKKEKKRKRFWPVFGRVMLSLFLVGLITVFLVVGSVMIYAFNFVDAEMAEDLENLSMNFTTTVYVKNETSGEWEEYQRLHSGGKNRIWVPLEEIPEDLQHAFIAIEDKRFLDHNGVDWKRTFSAFLNMFMHFYDTEQGGSTITQQLVKNLTGDKNKDAMRKIREIMRARYLEEKFPKDTILECYLNIVGFANGISGVEVASNYYFDKKTSELNLTECAALAAMAKEPERYRPDKNPEQNAERRGTVLREMLDQGYITEEEYESAKAATLTVTASKDSIKEAEINSYFIDTLIDDVIHDLSVTYNYDETYASKNFYNGGYKIYCTLIPSIQSTIEKYYKNPQYFTETQVYNGQTYPIQSSFTITDYEGHVVGIVGGQGEKTVNRGTNRATDGYNQPGSTIKPLSAYAPALEDNTITYSSFLEDKQKFRVDGKLWPSNWYGGTYGNVMAFKALEHSCNTIPVNLVNDIGVQKSFTFLHDTVGYTGFDEEKDMNLAALGLGGCYRGVTTRQAAAAFSIFGNLGKYYSPTTYLTVTDQLGKNVILTNEDRSPVPALSEDTACIMNHMLQNVIYGSSGTGGAGASYSRTMKAYAKTGTSNDEYDNWFVGGSPYYVGACWYGFDYNGKVRNSGTAGILWSRIMREIHQDLPAKEFLESDYVTRRRYCTSTGMVATTRCYSTGIGYYKTSYLPACTRHGGNLAASLDPPKKNTSSSSTTSSR